MTTKELKHAQPADVAEVLRHVPGHYCDTGGGRGTATRCRHPRPGPRGDCVACLSSKTACPWLVNLYAEPDIYYVPAVERIRGVEVVKGSGNILFGPQTIGGVINFLTLVPPDYQHETVETNAGF